LTRGGADDIKAPMTDAPIYALSRPSPKLFWLYLARSFAGLVFQPLVFIPLYLKFKTIRYRFDEKGIHVSWGKLFHHQIYLTYGRIQDIHVTEGLVERWLGLGTVEVQTASGSAGAELSIVGFEQFRAIRDFLYARMRGIKDEASGAAAAPAEALALLRGIRDGLRDLAAAVAAKRAAEPKAEARP
jgi:putative membrane protein